MQSSTAGILAVAVLGAVIRTGAPMVPNGKPLVEVEEGLQMDRLRCSAVKAVNAASRRMRCGHQGWFCLRHSVY